MNECVPDELLAIMPPMVARFDRGDVRSELQTERFHLLIEVVEDATGLNARPALGGVDFQHVVEVFGAVEYDARSDRTGPPAMCRRRGPSAERRSGSRLASVATMSSVDRGSTTPSGTIW